jgi:hypothetical protein
MSYRVNAWEIVFSERTPAAPEQIGFVRLNVRRGKRISAKRTRRYETNSPLNSSRILGKPAGAETGEGGILRNEVPGCETGTSEVTTMFFETICQPEIFGLYSPEQTQSFVKAVFEIRSVAKVERQKFGVDRFAVQHLRLEFAGTLKAPVINDDFVEQCRFSSRSGAVLVVEFAFEPVKAGAFGFALQVNLRDIAVFAGVFARVGSVARQ